MRKLEGKRSTSHTRYSKKQDSSSSKKKISKKNHPPVKKNLAKKRRLVKSPLKKSSVKTAEFPKKNIEKKSKKLATVPKIKEKKLVPEFYVGEITHYFDKISVVVVKVVEHPVLIGDLIHIKGSAVDFMQKVSSLQVESKDVRFARKGELVGLQVNQPAKPGDKVYKIKK